MNDQVRETACLLWDIYNDIGRSDGAATMRDADKAKLVEDLRQAAQLLEDQLPVYN